MAGVGEASAIVSLIQALGLVIEYGIDVYKAQEERERLRNDMWRYQLILSSIKERLDDYRTKHKPADSWYINLLAVMQGCGTLQKDGTILPLPGADRSGSMGSAAQLQLVVGHLIKKLAPTHGVKKAFQSLVYSKEKKNIEAMLADIMKLITEISFLLDADDRKLLLSMKDDGVEIEKHLKHIRDQMEKEAISIQAQLNLSEAIDEKVDNVSIDLKSTSLQGLQSLKATDDRVKTIESRQLQDRIEREMERKEQRKKDQLLEKKRIEEWLSPLKDLARQSEIVENCFPLGQWLLESVAYKHWIEGRPWHLRLDGEPGSGKTVLASLVARRLQDSFPKLPVMCLFLDHRDGSHQSPVNLFGSLLKQLIQLSDLGTECVPQDLQKLYAKAQAIDARPSLRDVCDFLKAHLTTYARTFIIVDGLDEAPQLVRNALLKQLLGFGSDRISLLVTSRADGSKRDNTVFCNRCEEDPISGPIYYRCKLCGSDEEGDYYDVCQICRDKGLSCKDASHQLSEPYSSVEMDVRTPDKEIERYVNWELGQETESSETWDPWTHNETLGTTRLQRLCLEHPELMEEIPRKVVEMAGGTFLYAKLYMDALKVQTDAMAVMDTLDDFPTELPAMYKDQMDRIDAQDRYSRDLAYRILAITCCAHRNLRVAELKHVLAVQQHGVKFDNSFASTSVQTMLECTLGLVQISDIEGDQGAVRTHATLQEYFNAHRPRHFPDAEKDMAAACLLYLNLDAFSKPSSGRAAFEAKKKRYPFISYASQYWGDHVRESYSSDTLLAETLRLVCDPARMTACIEAAWLTGEGGTEGWDVRKGLDDLHVCAWYGLSGVLEAIEPNTDRVDTKEPTYLQTPLMYACRKGHVEVAAQLLNLGASPNQTSARGRTPLFEAIGEGRDEIVDLLLGRKDSGIDVNSVQHAESDRTALMQAARFGHEEIVRKLLDDPFHDIDVNQQDSFGYTALALAVEHGFPSVVQLLLRRSDLAVDLKEYKTERTPLILAAERDYPQIVDMLLQKGADWRQRDRDGGTAALRAVDYGCTAALSVLASNEEVLQCVDDDGRTILHGASRGGHPEIVSLCLKKGLDKDKQDNNGLTPLHEASWQGRPGVTKVLIDRGANSSLTDNFSRTPWDVAWQYGHGDVVGLLHQPDQLPDDEALPIWSLARRGLKASLVKALRERKGEVSQKEPCIENSALHCAVFAEDPEILQMLVQDAQTLIDDVNHVGRTPLHVAALQGNLHAAQCLIDHKAKLDKKDRWGDTPLRVTQSNKHHTVMMALIEAGDLLDIPEREIQKMLFIAAEIGSVKAANILLEKGATTNDKDGMGRTALQIALDTDNEEMIDVLRSTQTFYQRSEATITEAKGTTNAESRPPMPSIPSSQRYMPFRSPGLRRFEFQEPELPALPSVPSDEPGLCRDQDRERGFLVLPNVPNSTV